MNYGRPLYKVKASINYRNTVHKYKTQKTNDRKCETFRNLIAIIAYFLNKILSRRDKFLRELINHL